MPETGFKLSVGVPWNAYLLETESLFTPGSRPGRTVGEPVGGIFYMDCSDWSSGIRYHIFDTRPDTEFNRPISVYRFQRRALTLCPQLCMGIQPDARFPVRSADALSATLYGHFIQAIYRNRPIATTPDTVKIMIRLDRPPEVTNTNQTGVDTTWTLNISGPVGRTNCR
jgi:hypothetical protein